MHRTGTLVTHLVLVTPLAGPADAVVGVAGVVARRGCQTAQVTSRRSPCPRQLVRRIVSGREDRLTHLEVLPAREGAAAQWPQWLDPALREALRSRGIDQPWTHQVTAADAAWSGTHVVLATGTASGKSLAYQMPALSRILASGPVSRRRGSTTLYLAPTKALEHDQLEGLRALRLPGVHLATHDADSSREQREWTRAFAEYVLTNPDMLHHSLLPRHREWARFWSLLDFVVVDECHHYRGVFGAHVAQLLRRLRRVCGHHGSDPTFVLASATVAEPEASAHRLTGLPVRPITDDGSPHGEVHLALWEPPLSGRSGENGAPVRRPAGAELADLLADLVAAGARTLAFSRSRRGAETVAADARRLLTETAPDLAGRVAAYRAGYLPEERRELESALRSGSLLGLAATSALEMGMDIAGLDAVLMSGFPGTRAAMWQQVGRAGRAGSEALGVLVARDDPLDTYLVHHPGALLGVPVEASVFDPDNPHVLGPHLCAAAAELPLTEPDLALFGPNAVAGIQALADAGLLRRRPAGWYWTSRRRASELADIRSSGGPSVRLVEEETGRLIGSVDASSAHGTVHRGAVYVHQGDTFIVKSLDLAESTAILRPAAPGYWTQARELTAISILEETQHKETTHARTSFGRVSVTRQVVSFLRKDVATGEVLAEEQLDLPERILDTKAVWWTTTRESLAGAGIGEPALPGAAHAAEHAAIGMLPLYATCDRWDIGGVSTPTHPQTGALTVFVYDGHPGGAGFAERGFQAADGWLRSTREAIVACRCVDGCPSCVQSPKCGNGNQPLDKHGAGILLELLAAGEHDQ
jgi:DEAD/DEAH box helicase domain-containing protein